MRFLIPLAVFLVMVIFLAIGLTLDPREVPSPFIGKPAPAFALPQVADAQKTLAPADFKGQVALVNVWASWCVSCRQEHPVLVELAKRKLVPIYGLNYKDQREDALAWLDRYGNPYTASAFDADGKTGIDWGVYGVPETFVIDRAGIIRHKFTGPITPEILENTLLPLIRQLQGSPS
ncbi:DsbE family thiol:disulfide interchange protein [Methylomagnum ishizawai]|uniref:DsbE family thiol:disulfide interchange protein n=1 Tax=Methylomagnum ishizawai TaxID=1760988 RepID=UPI001C33C4BD|nr:DsbE family thiol:disulfide interchange protein [Methylomagnum ishizawai]BBL76977.1 thiol:disulfide interchange protein [Methylomagnum ishizawai]